MQKTAGTRVCQKFTASTIDEIPADCKGKIVKLTLPDTSYQAGRSMWGGGIVMLVAYNTIGWRETKLTY